MLSKKRPRTYNCFLKGSTDIIRQITSISLSILGISDRMTWKFTQDWNFSLKLVTWTNNDNISPHRRVRLLSDIWNLIFCFIWRFVFAGLSDKSCLQGIWLIDIRITWTIIAILQQEKGGCTLRFQNCFFFFFCRDIWIKFLSKCRTLYCTLIWNL